MPMRISAGSADCSVASQLIRPMPTAPSSVLTTPSGLYMNFHTSATTICDIAIGKK